MTSLTYIHERLAKTAEEFPQGVALYLYDGTQVSYQQLWQKVQTAAQWMSSQGVSAGHRVMTIGENCLDMVVSLFACSHVGAWSVGVNARLSAREVDNIIEHAQPRCILFPTTTSKDALQHAQRLAAVAADNTVWQAGMYALARPAVAESFPEHRAVAALIYTSGTTGQPKGVMVTHKGLLHFAACSSASRRLTNHDISYAALPLSHIFGIATVLMSSVQVGAALVVRHKFDASALLKELETLGITIFQGVPTMYVRILELIDSGVRFSAPRLRYIYTGAAALDPQQKKRAESLFGLPMHHGYGITEYAGSMFVTPIDAPRADTSVGFPFEGVEYHIGELHDPSAAPLEKGDIYISGPGLMLGYYKNPEETAGALLPAKGKLWLKTGDIGYIDQQGALFISGRTKDVIIRSGFNVYPLEVEAVLNTHPSVRLSAVVGVEQPDKNEEVVAFVEPAEGKEVPVEELLQFAKESLAPYKRPVKIYVIDTIPTTVSGKILKQPLREQAKHAQA